MSLGLVKLILSSIIVDGTVDVESFKEIRHPSQNYLVRVSSSRRNSSGRAGGRLEKVAILTFSVVNSTFSVLVFIL